ncbi:MAG: diphosphomevalonate decarboxylase, partial [Spirochaetota bacterium]
MSDVIVQTSPSLALIKYWGKVPDRVNVPATASIAVGLHDLRTVTRITPSSSTHRDTVVIGGDEQPLHHFTTVIETMRSRATQLGVRHAHDPILVESRNSFPTAAGIASSSSGFAALVLALNEWWELSLPTEELSAVARSGSGSAARSVYGGFTHLDAGAESARPLYDGDWWADLRILVAITDTGKKSIGSRAAMERTRRTSPYYEAWVTDARSVAANALDALAERSLDLLGPLMRASYLRMVGTSIAASPPVMYWLPASVGVIHACESLRNDGCVAWETMDAGPQVKILTQERDVDAVRQAVGAVHGVQQVLVSRIGGDPVIQQGRVNQG